MANGRAATAARGAPADSPTRASVVNTWGKAIAKQVGKGESVFQKPHNLLPPRTLPLADTRPRTGFKPTAPMRFHGMNAIILRTLSVQRGHKDPTFALENTARAFNAQHGDSKVRPLRPNATVVDLPNTARNADEPLKRNQTARLAEDGPNHDEFGRAVEGKQNDMVRDEKGALVKELVEIEGARRAPGLRPYYHRDDFNLPQLEARPLPTQASRDSVLATTMASSRRHGLQVEETPDMAGRATLTMEPKGTQVGDEKLKEDRYTLRVGSEDSFASRDHHVTATIHEVSRFSMCRDGNKDAIAVAKADPDPAVREKMPEFARSEMIASAATMEKVTSVGMTWHPPVHQRENVRDIRSAQAAALREPGGLDKVGGQAYRVERMNDNKAPTTYDQAERNRQRQERAPGIEDAARGQRGARPMQRASAPATGTPGTPGGGEAAPAAPAKRRSRATRAAAATPATPAAASAGGVGKRASRATPKIGTQPKAPATAPAVAAGASGGAAGRGKPGSPDKGGDAKPPR